MRLARAGAVAGVVVYCLVAVGAAVYAVLLVPVRVGTVLVPVSVVLAAVTNVALPRLTRDGADHVAAAAAPVAAWLLTVMVLAGSRPEGDVLLPGAGALVYVFYAVVGVGLLAGIITVGRMDTRGARWRLRADRSGQASAPGSVPPMMQTEAPRPQPPR